MHLLDATRMILDVSTDCPELMKVTRDAHAELSTGRGVDHGTLNWMLREACRRNLYGVLIQKNGRDAFEDMVTVLCREIDRQAPVLSR